MMRNAVDTLFDTGQWGYLSATAGVLVDTLLAARRKSRHRRSRPPDPTVGDWAGEAPLYREVWLLRLRALVARARGKEIRYRELAQRYRVLATSLGFEGHMAMAEALSSSTAAAGEKTSGGVFPRTAPAAVPVTGDAIPRGRIRRTIPLAGFAARAAGDRIVAGLREKTGDTGAVARFHERSAERYSELLGHSKGVLMKIGQILSMFDTNTRWQRVHAVSRSAGKAASRRAADGP